MPTAEQPKTLANIRDAIRIRAKVDSSDTFTLDAIEGFINQRYLNIATEQKWRWLKDKRSIRVNDDYTAGTVTTAADSREITGAGAASWDADFVGRMMTISGETAHYEIVGRNSSTRVQLAERVTRAAASGLSYAIYQADYGLWPDLEAVDEVWHEYGGTKQPVKAISPNEYWALVANNPGATGKPIYYTREGFKPYEGAEIGQFVVGYDFVGQLSSYRLMIWPRRVDDDYTLHISYVRKAEPLAADSDEPLIPLEDRWVLIYGGLADLYAMQGNETSTAYWNTEFEKGIKRMLRDQDDTDSKARLTVPDIWRKRIRPSAARYDLGTYFDTE